MMPGNKPVDLCPCGSQLDFAQCCGRYIKQGDFPATAKQLMRSRYTAFVLGESEYLLASWHPRTRPADGLSLDRDISWRGLEVLQSCDGGPSDTTGSVEFIARYKVNGRAGKLHEKSHFEKYENRWMYVDGELDESHNNAPSRNQPCACGSGKKYKRCCGK